jgi:hypothetical protein
MMNAAASPDPEELAEPATADNAQEEAAEPQSQGGGDNSPLSSIEVEPAANGGAIVTHRPKVSDRVRHMGRHEPKKHVSNRRRRLLST